MEIWVNHVLQMTLPGEAMVIDPELKRSSRRSKRAPRNNTQIVLPKVLHAQAIAIGHEGHMQADG